MNYNLTKKDLKKLYSNHTDILDYSSNIIINDSNRWQLIASSQNYDSNYSIFGQFKTEIQSNNNLKITKAEFKLINYKNTIPLGIEEVTCTKNNTILEFKFFVRAFAEKNGFSDDKIFQKENVNLEVSAGDILHTRRTILPMHKVDEQTYSAQLKEKRLEYDYSIWDSTGKIKTKKEYALANDPKLPNSIVDTEFFFKDGNYIQYLNTYNYQNKAPGKRCRDAYFIILIANE